MIFTIEGNIGAGKSSLLKLLEDVKFDIEHVVVYEPVDEWMNAKPDPDGPSIFELYYKDKMRYGFMFQMYALQTRIKHIAEVVNDNPGKIIICERCHLTDYEIFAKMLHEQSIINDSEYFVYKSWYNFMVQTTGAHINGVIYLKVNPDICVKRIIKRNRQGEEAIDIDYIKQLHEQHEHWLGNVNVEKEDVYVVDGNNDGDVDVHRIINFVNRQSIYKL
jgi:deoxyguanosine kinase